MTQLIPKALLLILLGSFCLSAQPALETSLDEYEFGWTPHSSTAITEIILRSIGDDTLWINDVVSTCRCLTMHLPQQSIAPGDSLIAPIIWISDQKPGAHNHYFSIYTNEPDRDQRPRIVKSKGITVLNFETLAPLSFQPYRLEFSRIGSIDIDSIPFTITNNSTRNLDLTLVHSPAENFELVIPTFIAANTVEQGWARLKLDNPETELEESITIALRGDHRYERFVTIPLRRKTYSN